MRILPPILVPLLCVVLLSACQFGGYVPKGKHQPVAEEERDIADLPFDQQAKGELDCEGGRCRVRYRVMITGPGKLEVTVTGPRGKDTPDGFGGPRLARAVLQDVYGTPVSRNDAEQFTGPMQLASDVSEGPYFILIQGLGGAFEYGVVAHYQPLAGAVTPSAAAAAASGVSGVHSPDRAGTAAAPRPPPGAGGDRPGDVSDGADYAFDPRANMQQWKTYAFADNPQAQLEGEAPEGHGNPFVIRSIQREIRYVLADQGLQQVPADEADFLIAVQVGSSTTTWYSLDNVPVTTPYADYFNGWRAAGGFVSANTFVDGTLVIDFIDPKSKKLVWHGWTTEPVNVKLDNEKLLQKSVKTVLAQFVNR